MNDLVHGKLPCGIEYGLVPLKSRHVVSFQIRVLSGAAAEPASKAGLSRLLEQTIDKGTQSRTGRELFDEFDAIGASASSGVGRETTSFVCTTLPEHFERAVELHAEMLRSPTFPEDSVSVAKTLALQELKALEDDPQSLTDVYISRRAFGPQLGRIPLGSEATVQQITRSDIVDHWRSTFCAGNMLIAVAGPVTKSQVEDLFEKHFADFGNSMPGGRDFFPVKFTPGTEHHNKDLQQEQISICWPGVDAVDKRYPVQQIVLGVLSGGMSGRLFTEVREKLALVYWVSAWQELPRGSGMMFLGASTTPDRCDQTFETLLKEVERLTEDVEDEEIERAITGIMAHRDTRGEATRSRCAEIASDLFFFGRPMTHEEKTERIRSVDRPRFMQYLEEIRRDRLCVVTVGPKALAGS